MNMHLLSRTVLVVNPLANAEEHCCVVFNHAVQQTLVTNILKEISLILG